MDDLHKISLILIERETIDKDQFERLLAGEAEETVFPEEIEVPVEAPVEGPQRKPAPKPKPRPCRASRCSRPSRTLASAG